MKKSEWSYQTIDCLCNKINGLWKGKKGPFIKVGVIRNANFTKEFTLCFDNIEYLDVEERQYSSRKLQKGDIIVEKSGGSEKQPVGRCVLFDKDDGDFSFSNFTSVLRIKNRSVISPEYLYKYMLFVYRRGDTRAMQKAATGIHNIEFDKFLAILIPIPPLAEQQEIVDYLDKAFAKIDALKKNAEQQLSDAKALFSAALEESMSPKKGWDEKTLRDIVVIKHGKDYKDIPNNRSKYPVYGSGEEVIAYVDEFSCSANTIILGRKGTIDKPRFVDHEYWNIDTAFSLSSKDGYSIKYIYYFTLTVDWKSLNSGSAKPSLTQTLIYDQEISVPSLPTQQTIVAHLDALSATVNQLQENYNKILRECDALKQALLREIFEQ